MASNEHFFVSIDIGSSKIAALIAEVEKARLSIFGYAKGDSAGVSKGNIVDIDKTTRAITAVVEKIRKNYNIDFHSVSANISDSNLTIVNDIGKTPISNNTISATDMVKAIKSASVNTSNNQQIINRIINYWTLDKDPKTNTGLMTNDPAGQQANTLEVNVHFVITDTQPVNSIEKSIRDSNLGLANVVLNSIASSEAYITQDEKDRGVCLLDIGAEVTNIAVFTKFGMIYNDVILSAGLQISQAIADAFETSIKEAERLKITYGYAQSKLFFEDELIQFRQIDDDRNSFHYLSRQQLIEVIEQAYLSLFALIKENLTAGDIYHLLKSGFVLTGGASKIKGCGELALDYFKIRSKVGRINTDRIGGNQAIIDDAEYGCAMGLLLFEPNELDMEETQEPNILGKMMRNFK